MKIINNKAGVTVLEGVIALGLLAVVTAGAFGVLLSAARKSSQPDMREEMALAVEKAKDRLQVYLHYSEGRNYLPDDLKNGLCTNGSPVITDNDPLGSGSHHIECLLPPICDKESTDSVFTYELVSPPAVNLSLLGDTTTNVDKATNGSSVSTGLLKIEFQIACNGYEL